MTENLAIALAGAIPPTIIALGALISSINNGRKVDRVSDTVDGNLSKVQEDLAIAVARISVLDAVIRRFVKPTEKLSPVQEGGIETEGGEK